MTNEELITEIRKAFTGLSKPETTLRVARGADDHDYDWKKLQKLDDHYDDWEDIPDKDLDYYQDVFFWLCPQGLQYYLPAYMVRYLKRVPLGKSNDIWPEYAFDERCFELNLFELFTTQQTQVALCFLETLFEQAKDDYHDDWWNHSWDKDWEYDKPKQKLWNNYGTAYKILKTKLIGGK